MTKKSELGRLGEDFACEYLINKGYRIIERNYRRKWGELDIIAKAPDKTLVFMEVKTMAEYRRHNKRDNDDDHDNYVGLNPEDQLTKAKLRKLQKTASLYAGNHPELVNDNKGWRIDLIAITINHNQEPDIKHYENI